MADSFLSRSFAGSGFRRQLFVFSGGFLLQKRLRRILELSGFDLRLGLPAEDDEVAVWGRTSVSKRGRAVAKKRDAGLVSIEDAFLRSVKTGRAGDAPVGLVIDKRGIYFDTENPSDLEDILNFGRFEDSCLIRRAEEGIAALKSHQISKYNAYDIDAAPVERDYVLVVDQTHGDASIGYGGANAESFERMLDAARRENPGKTILIKSHPEVQSGYRIGHFSHGDCDERTRFEDRAISPWQLLEHASAVYCVTSMMGFEAILAGHRPRVFGKPFYAGWGLSDDMEAMPRHKRKLTTPELFAGAMLMYPTWYDVYHDRLGDFEDAVAALSEQSRAWREDRNGYLAVGMRLWKRNHLRAFLGDAGSRLRFSAETAPRLEDHKGGSPILVWASKETKELRDECHDEGIPLLRMEDGFIRSRGLGAKLIAPLSLVIDDLGIYYDPSRESRLERLIAESDQLTSNDLARAAKLRRRLIATGLSKYNIGEMPETLKWPVRQRRILVPGQVEDDASIRLGTGKVDTNLALLQAARSKNPSAFIVYKPHPDIEAGLRAGHIDDELSLHYADVISRNSDPISTIEACDEVWTMTSLLGFEALLRGKPVTCTGMPFYAGWGLTTDIGPSQPRRKQTPSLDALVHATLIAYPRYHDPVTNLPCSAEIAVERLENGVETTSTAATKMLSKIQGMFASYAPLWR